MRRMSRRVRTVWPATPTRTSSEASRPRAAPLRSSWTPTPSRRRPTRGSDAWPVTRPPPRRTTRSCRPSAARAATTRSRTALGTGVHGAVKVRGGPPAVRVRVVPRHPPGPARRLAHHRHVRDLPCAPGAGLQGQHPRPVAPGRRHRRGDLPVLPQSRPYGRQQDQSRIAGLSPEPAADLRPVPRRCGAREASQHPGRQRLPALHGFDPRAGGDAERAAGLRQLLGLPRLARDQAAHRPDVARLPRAYPPDLRHLPRRHPEDLRHVGPRQEPGRGLHRLSQRASDPTRGRRALAARRDPGMRPLPPGRAQDVSRDLPRQGDRTRLHARRQVRRLPWLPRDPAGVRSPVHGRRGAAGRDVPAVP